MTTAAPDCLAFARDALADAGALVEETPSGVLVLAPAELAGELAIAEECEILPDAGAPASVALGSALLDRLIERVRAGGNVAPASVEAEPPRAAQARSLGERFTLRNAVHEVADVLPGHAPYAVAWIRWSAECDDRFEGRVRVAVCETTGGAPDEEVGALLDPVTSTALSPRPSLSASGEDARVAAWLCRRAELASEDALEAVSQSALRRKRRDHARITEYFEELAAEAVRGKRRARVDAAALARRIDQYREERDAKLRELDARFSIRVSLAPVAVVRAELPVLFVRLRVRRRKLDRELLLVLPPRAARLDRPACECCGGPAEAPALCDDSLHVVCERCVPDARGRFACPACRAAAR